MKIVALVRAGIRECTGADETCQVFGWNVLRLFDELVKCDEESLLKGVREVIEAKPLVE